ncbi:hypothetical protein BBM1605_03850 [Bifidobacterium breve MCC 1605]|nr:hypothetical protein BBM1605_03850 [Bifidobacterium breve MCC 1605]
MDTRQHSGTAGGNQTTSSAQRSEYLRNKALAAAIDDGESVAGAARRYGVSRRWAHKIKRRWDADGGSGLLPRSRAAHTIARADAVPASRIVELRKQLEKDGPDAGAESIAAGLEREGVGPPANSAIHRILVSAGPVRPEPGKRPRRRTRGSRRPRPTNCGSRTSPTGRSPRFREPWSSPGSTTAPATRCTRVRSPR